MSRRRFPRVSTRTSPTSGVKDDTDDFTARCRRRPVRGGRRVHARARSPGPAWSSAAATSPTARRGRWSWSPKNANVATGAQGLADAEEVVAGVAAALGCAASARSLIASTGVIGRHYPMDAHPRRARGHPLAAARRRCSAVARGIMTTDTVAEDGQRHRPAPPRIVGVAKGVGMIEPNMATMIAMFFTDAALSPAELDTVFRSVVDRTFNCVSVDTDTSTSDTAVILASGAAGPVDADAFEAALYDVVRVAHQADRTRRRGRHQAHRGDGRPGGVAANRRKRVAKAIVNSPLVKTAVHGADPNWGRVAMAVGKSTSSERGRPGPAVVIRFGSQEVYPARAGRRRPRMRSSTYMRGADVRIHVSLATGGYGRRPRCGAATSPTATSASTPTTPPDAVASSNGLTSSGDTRAVRCDRVSAIISSTADTFRRSVTWPVDRIVDRHDSAQAFEHARRCSTPPPTAQRVRVRCGPSRGRRCGGRPDPTGSRPPSRPVPCSAPPRG